MGRNGTGLQGGRHKNGDASEEAVVQRVEERGFVRSATGQHRAQRQQRLAQKEHSTRSPSPLPRFLRVSSEARGRRGGAEADDAGGYDGEEEAEARSAPPRAITFQPRRGRKAPSSQEAVGDGGGCPAPLQGSPAAKRALEPLELQLSPHTPRGTPRVLAALSPTGPVTPSPEGRPAAFPRSVSSNAAAGEPRRGFWGSRKGFLHRTLEDLGSAQEQAGPVGKGAEPDHHGGGAEGGTREADRGGEGAPTSSPVQRGFPRTRSRAPAVSPMRSLPRLRPPKLQVQVQDEEEESERHRTPFRRLRSQGAHTRGPGPTLGAPDQTRGPGPTLGAPDQTRGPGPTLGAPDQTRGPGPRSPLDAPEHARALPDSPHTGSAVPPKSPGFLLALSLLSPRPQPRAQCDLGPEGAEGRPRLDARLGAFGRSRSSSARVRKSGRGDTDGRASRGDAETRSMPARRADSARARKGDGGRRGSKGRPPLTSTLPASGQPVSPGEAAAISAVTEQERWHAHGPATSAEHPVLGSEAQGASPHASDGDACEPQSPPFLSALGGQQAEQQSPPRPRVEAQQRGGHGEEPLQAEEDAMGDAAQEAPPALVPNGGTQPAAEDSRLSSSAVQGRPASACAVGARQDPVGTEEGELQRVAEERGLTQSGLREGPGGRHGGEGAAQSGVGSDERHTRAAQNGGASDERHTRAARDGEADARRKGVPLEEGGESGKGPAKKRRPQELGKSSLRGEKGRGSLRRDFAAELKAARSRGDAEGDARGVPVRAGRVRASMEAMPLQLERSSSKSGVRRAENALSRSVPSPAPALGALGSQEPRPQASITASRSSSHRFSSRAPHSGPAPRAAGAAAASEEPGALGVEEANWRSNSMGARTAGARRPSLSLDVPAEGKDSTPLKARLRRERTSGAQDGEAQQEDASGAKGSRKLGAQDASNGLEEAAERAMQAGEEGSATPRRTPSRAPNRSPSARPLLSPRGAPQALDWRMRSTSSRSPFSRRRPPEVAAPERSPEAAAVAPAESPMGSEAVTPSRLGMMFFSRSKSLGLRTPGSVPMPGLEKGSGRAAGLTPSSAGPKTPSAADAKPKTPSAADAKRKARLEARQSSRNGRLAGSSAATGEGGLMGRGLSQLGLLYEMGEKVGEGRCGVSVRRCVERSSGAAYACKSTPKSMLQEPRKVDALRTEVAILEMLRGSPGIVQLKEVLEDAQEVHMVMELCCGGDLLTHINSCPHISEKQAATFCRLIACALQRCHAAGVLHRDLKPENVLITKSGSQADIRVADFGISTLLAPGQRVTGYAGSPYYVAPEVLTGSYGVEADVWSLGVILYVLLCQHLPFWDNDDAQIYQAILQGRYDTTSGAWLDISAQGIDLVRRMLCLDPRRRITLPHVLEHPWIVGNQLPELAGLLPATGELPDMKLSKRRRAIARTEGALVGTLKHTLCMTAVQRTLSSSSEAEERPDKLAFRAAHGGGSLHGLT